MRDGFAFGMFGSEVLGALTSIQLEGMISR